MLILIQRARNGKGSSLIKTAQRTKLALIIGQPFNHNIAKPVRSFESRVHLYISKCLCIIIPNLCVCICAPSQILVSELSYASER